MQKSAATYDYLIAGFGLAGAMLAWRLMQAGTKVMVVDPGVPSASKTAAGLINPVTGKRLVKQANAEQFLAAATGLYAELADQFGKQLFHPMPMLRAFRNDDEIDSWEKRLHNPAYNDFLGERLDSSDFPAPFIAPLGGFIQKQTGYLDTNGLMDGIRAQLMEQGAFMQDELHYANLEIGEDGIRWKDIHARRIIFCEGYRMMNNPWFGYLPLQLAKGEILTLKTAQKLPSFILNAGKWIIPLDQHSYRTGANYEWQHLDETPTPGVGEALEQAADELTSPSLAGKPVTHLAGVRPGTLDKQPFIGSHPDHPALFIFNGFGSKGSMLIPWYSEQTANHLLHDAPLPPEADIGRIEQ